MQSYAMIVGTSLNEAGIDSLEKKLKLPKDWKFRVRTLDEDLVLKNIEGGASLCDTGRVTEFLSTCKVNPMLFVECLNIQGVSCPNTR
jgi:hypothetical protein